MKYCDQEEEDCVAFRKDETGRLQVVVDFPHIVFQPVPWYENRTLNFVLLSSIVVVFALTLALWPASEIIRSHYGRKLDLFTTTTEAQIIGQDHLRNRSRIFDCGSAAFPKAS
jgi:hypothetical protein